MPRGVFKRIKPSKRKNKLEDIWKYINKRNENDCWEWIGCIRSDGYGIFGVDNKRYRSHRLVYEQIYNSIPKGLEVMHICDNPKCCNPNHLKLGTHKDNMQDMINKKRDIKSSGEKSGRHVLREIEVKKIRQLYSTGLYSTRKLGIIFNIGKSAVYQIISRQTWKRI